MKKPLILLIKLYQRTLSPDQGLLRYLYNNSHMHCVMYPSCSEYMILSIEKFGVRRGVLKGIKRIGRCNPYQKTFVDMP